MRYIIGLILFTVTALVMLKCRTPDFGLNGGGISPQSDKIIIKRNSGDVIFVLLDNDCTKIERISKDTLLIEFKIQ